MMRRLTSGPKPAARVNAITSSALCVPSSPTRNPYRMASKRARFDETSDGRIR
jgi:hypothetical protein